MFNKEYTKRMMSVYFTIWALVVLIIISIFIMYKYHVKGETNMPFEISSIYIISSAQTENIKLYEKNEYSADTIQTNDIYISVEKNRNYNKDEIIKKITIDNFSIAEESEKGDIKIYRTSDKEDKQFEYKEEYETDNITYIGSLNHNDKGENLEIANQGGIIKFSICQENLGTIYYNKDENIVIDGTILNKLNISEEDIKKKISFDFKIEIQSGIIFYTTIEIPIPVDNILEEGIKNYEIKGTDNLIFKRK